MNLGERISNLRKSKKMTQQDLANKIYVTDKTVSSWESNRTEPGLEIIVKLSEIFDCSIGYLIYGDNIKSDVETEIKIKLSKNEFDELNDFMNEKAKFINENRQVDTYYQPTHRKFLKKELTNEWLRIGIRGNKKILNYKNWHSNMFCDEFEVEIDNSENLDKILKILGLEIICVVDKVRKTFLYLDKYEIALDHVKELGYFIEIEVKKYSGEPIEEYDELIRLAKKMGLNLDNIDKRGHPYNLIYNK